MKIFEDYKKTLKSSETDDWVDVKIVRPFAYLFAKFFARLGTHPNTVTIISMFIGAVSALGFMHGSYYYEGSAGLWFNIAAILLLLLADVLDCTDGQLARMTGKCSPMGRILDGIAGFAWFVPIYVLLVYRFYCHHSIEFGWFGIADTSENALLATVVVFILGLLSGIYGIAGQQRMADYYIQVHLFFLKGEKGSELDNSMVQKELYESKPWKGNFIWKFFQWNYVGYTRKQEKRTPEFQHLLAVLKEKYGTAINMPSDVRQQLHDSSLKLMFLNGLLTFNFRTFWLVLFCLIDLPAEFFIFEAGVMSLLCFYIINRHEAFCRRVAQQIA